MITMNTKAWMIEVRQHASLIHQFQFQKLSFTFINSMHQMHMSPFFAILDTTHFSVSIFSCCAYIISNKRTCLSLPPRETMRGWNRQYRNRFTLPLTFSRWIIIQGYIFQSVIYHLYLACEANDTQMAFKWLAFFAKR